METLFTFTFGIYQINVVPKSFTNNERCEHCERAFPIAFFRNTGHGKFNHCKIIDINRMTKTGRIGFVLCDQRLGVE